MVFFFSLAYFADCRKIRQMRNTIVEGLKCGLIGRTSMRSRKAGRQQVSE